MLVQGKDRHCGWISGGGMLINGLRRWFFLCSDCCPVKWNGTYVRTARTAHGRGREVARHEEHGRQQGQNARRPGHGHLSRKAFSLALSMGLSR